MTARRRSGRVGTCLGHAVIAVLQFLHVVLLNHGLGEEERYRRKREGRAVGAALRADGRSWGEELSFHGRSVGERIRERLTPGGEPTSIPTGLFLIVAFVGQLRLVLHDPAGRISGSAMIALLYCAAVALVGIMLMAFPTVRHRAPYALCSLFLGISAAAHASLYRDPNLVLDLTRKVSVLGLAVGLFGVCLWALLWWRDFAWLFTTAIVISSAAGYGVALSAYLSVVVYRADPVAAVASMLLAHGALAAAATAPRLRWVPTSSETQAVAGQANPSD